MVNILIFLKKNRRKNKFLPIFKSHTDNLDNKIKKMFLQIRTFLIVFLFKLKLKKGPQ